MDGTELNKIRRTAVDKLASSLGNDLAALILVGSALDGAYRADWSDIDIVAVLSKLDFDIKSKIAEVIADLEGRSGIHHGINVVRLDEVVSSVNPGMQLDGKTLQALAELSVMPSRLIFHRRGISTNSFIVPDERVIKEYSYWNIMMLTLASRRSLSRTRIREHSELKSILKRELKTAKIISKLAVQAVRGEILTNQEDIVNAAKHVFPELNLEFIQKLDLNIDRWKSMENWDDGIDLLDFTEMYIEMVRESVLRRVQMRIRHKE